MCQNNLAGRFGVLLNDDHAPFLLVLNNVSPLDDIDQQARTEAKKYFLHFVII